MTGMFTEFRLAARSLSKAPGFSLLAIMILGIGLGFTVFMYSALNGYIFSPLPFDEADRIMHLERNQLSEGIESMEVTQADFVDWRREQTSFDDISGFYEGTVNISGVGADRPDRYDGAFITPGGLSQLRVQPELGRFFREEEGQPGGPDVVLLGYNVWQFRYNGDTNIVGRIIRVNSKPAEIVGVMPERFRFPINSDVWVPLKIDLSEFDERIDGTTLEVFGRLRDGVSQDQALAEFQTLAANLEAAHPDTNDGISAVIKPYTDEYIGGGTEQAILTLFAGAVLIMLIACANVANLIMARAVKRQREMAIRAAIGSTRGRLVMTVLAETTILALLASVLALFASYWGGRAVMNYFVATDSAPPFWVDLEPDMGVFLVTVGIALSAAFIAGIMPALRAAKIDLNSNLKEGGHGMAGGVSKMATTLVVVEIALSCALLVGAGLVSRSIIEMNQRELGADVENVIVGRMGLFEEAYPTGASQRQFFRDVADRMAAQPGVIASTATTSLPGDFASGFEWITIDGYELPTEVYGRFSPYTQVAFVEPDYFPMFAIPVIAGEPFTLADREDTEPVVMVTRQFVEWAFPDMPMQEAIGRRVRFAEVGHLETDEVWRRIVAVTESVHIDDLTDDPQPTTFVPLAQQPSRFAFVAAKIRGDALAFADRFRSTVQQVDSDIPVYWLQTAEQRIQAQISGPNVQMVLFMLMAAAAIMLSAGGLYAVLAYSVGQRTQEIGVRRALGALDQSIIRMVARRGTWQLGLGLGVGLILAFGFGQLLSNQLFGVDPLDPLSYLIAISVLGIATVLATLVPTRRALRIDPMQALRYE
jgi:putative ABC transport system permease protein